MSFQDKRGYEFSFTWIFTIFVGATVIFFAIYFANQIVGSKNLERNTVEGKSLGTLLTPIETQTEQGKFSKILLSDETKFYFECRASTQSDPFGTQVMRISIKPSVGGEWNDINSNDQTFHNKYIFSSKELQGKENVFVLSKPLFLPFKVADLLMIWDDNTKYCISGTISDSRLSQEINGLNLQNLRIPKSSEQPCDPETEKIICFNSNCDINIVLNQQRVIKSNGDLFYPELSNEDPYTFLFAAIFSDPEIYNCQMQRLLNHASILSDVYIKKSQKINLESGCSQTLQGTLQAYQSILIQTSQNPTSINLKQVSEKSKEVNDENAYLGCSLF